MSDRVQVDGGRWGLRVIRAGGRVKWCGRWYRIEDGPLPRAEYEAIRERQSGSAEMQNHPPRPKYDGCMDGKRGLFYSYGPHSGIAGINLHSIEGEEWPGSTCVAGVFVWADFEPERADG